MEMASINEMIKEKINEKINEKMAKWPYMYIEKIDGYNYHLKDENNKAFVLNIEFNKMDPMPIVGDKIYLSDKILDDISHKNRFFTFSTHIGAAYARPPHDFMKDPMEFIIFEYSNGKTILLERWYG